MNTHATTRMSQKAPNYAKIEDLPQPPKAPKAQNINFEQMQKGDQTKLISIIKSHTANINTSLSPRRNTLSPAGSNKSGISSRLDKSDAKPNGIKATIDASRFFSKPKTAHNSTQNSAYNSVTTSRAKLEVDPKSPTLDVDKVAEMDFNSNDGNQNKKLLEFIKAVKTKFADMEAELEKTKGEMVYYQRKANDQAEVIETLRKRER